jgi:hypothetical protein
MKNAIRLKVLTGGAVALLVAAVLATAGAGLGAAKPDREGPGGPGASAAVQLALAKAAIAKYKSVEVAKANGYVAGSPCLSTPINPEQTSYGGAMGIHFVNEALLKAGTLNPTKPPVLLYEPLPDGKLALTGAEWFRADADQNANTDGDRPTLFGRSFDGPMAGHGPDMPMHFDLHVWLFKRNPSGIFASWNPAVLCPSPEAHAEHSH